MNEAIKTIDGEFAQFLKGESIRNDFSMPLNKERIAGEIDAPKCEEDYNRHIWIYDTDRKNIFGFPDDILCRCGKKQNYSLYDDVATLMDNGGNSYEGYLILYVIPC